MADYIKIRVSDLEVNHDVMWDGRVHKVVERLGPVTVKMQRYKRKEIAKGTLEQRFAFITEDLLVDRVITR